MKKVLFVLLLLGNFYVSLLAQCGPDEAEVAVVIENDNWVGSDPTTYVLTNAAGDTLLYVTPNGNDLPSSTICVSSSACLSFTITDGYGDGICGYPPNIEPGSYTVYYNGIEVAAGCDFGDTATHLLGGCEDGLHCSFPIELSTPGNYTANLNDTWYTFTPTEAGNYQFNTCAVNPVCNTAVWVYDYCSGLTWDDTQESAYYYASDGCGVAALGTTYLVANQLYYIRIGDIDNDCTEMPIDWILDFLGPISGCMDATACNYEPLATVDSGDCTYMGDPACAGPDLIVLSDVLASSMYVTQRENSDDCYVAEGCMNGYGTRDILRFTTHIKNIGTQDYYIGSTPSTTTASDPQWEWDACHNHWHYEGYAEYVLYDMSGQEIPIGFKNGFCVMDLECSDGGTAKYNCGNQGITAQCGDIYDAALNCQWVDLTDVADGSYTFVVRVNWDQSPDALGRHELDYANNWAQVCIELTRASGNVAVNVSSDCDPYIDCAGNIYGSAQFDCEGVCNGNSLAGDLVTNNAYDYNDVFDYQQGILNNSLTANNCNDLNMDGAITATDAVLLIGCVLEETGVHTHPEGAAHSHCSLPSVPVLNPLEMIDLSIGYFNQNEQYVDIYLHNPNSHLMGYQFTINGLNISGVENLITDVGYNIDLGYNETGTIIGLSASASVTQRYIVPTPFLRVYYSSLTDNQICLGEVVAAINQSYEEVLGNVTTCVQPYVPVDVRILLQGAYNEDTDNMQADLLTNGVLPATQPFADLPWAYAGIEAFEVANVPAVIDWVLVEIREADIQTVVAQKAVLVLPNGSLYDPTYTVATPDETAAKFTDIASFNPDNQYFIVVRSRNHLDVCSAVPMNLSAGNTYDFTAQQSAALGEGQQVALAANRFALYAGDFNGDGIITVLDFNRYASTASTINQYISTDIDLDGNVTVSDFNKYVPNSSRIGVHFIRY